MATAGSAGTTGAVEELGARLRPELFRALGDPNRLRLVARLAAAPGPMTVTDASTCCGVHLSGVSRHLAQLARAGVVRAERHGREVRYVLCDDELIGALRGLADALEQSREACCAPAGTETT